MGVRILEDRDSGECCFYCSTTMWAFGTIMEDRDEAEEFLKWLGTDPRKLTDAEHEEKYYEFLTAKGVKNATNE